MFIQLLQCNHSKCHFFYYFRKEKGEEMLQGKSVHDMQIEKTKENRSFTILIVLNKVRVDMQA